MPHSPPKTSVMRCRMSCALGLVLGIVERKQLDAVERGAAGRRRDVGAARIFAALDEQFLRVLAHPELVEEERGVRACRSLDQTNGARLGRHAFRRIEVVRRLALLLGAPRDVVVGGEGGTALAALQYLGDKLG